MCRVAFTGQLALNHLYVINRKMNVKENIDGWQKAQISET